MFGGSGCYRQPKVRVRFSLLLLKEQADPPQCDRRRENPGSLRFIQQATRADCVACCHQPNLYKIMCKFVNGVTVCRSVHSYTSEHDNPIMQQAGFVTSNVLSLHRNCSLVILTSRFEATRGIFWDGKGILNHGQMTRTTPELAPSSPSFCTRPAGGRLDSTYDFTDNRPHTRRFSVESSFKPAVLRPQDETYPLDHRSPPSPGIVDMCQILSQIRRKIGCLFIHAHVNGITQKCNKHGIWLLSCGLDTTIVDVYQNLEAISVLEES
ncbi:hypothetical protein AVEN_172806-1 [Araneus ventricosus]|uniref:Uncharacterized protein n=1 Tax=Araneus ventricosus TaxID=182803 RepID=A0A4Y2BJW3_ARAVE|nr:hypothetical protein AVEN_172806-1 [Araneus ventricosus]